VKTIRIEGLRELRMALKHAEDANPRELTRALKEAGKPVPPVIRVNAPRLTGELAASVGEPRATGTKGRIPITAPHAPFVEFQRRGRAGATWSAKYGPPPRFGYRSLDSKETEIANILDRELKEILTAHGWLR
jgi:hypothetical protein